jgi:hypothetical protein
MQRPLFHPAFGSRPREIIGRDAVIARFCDGLSEPVGSQERCTFFVGQRGMGKTALLLELADRAQDLGFVPVRVTATESMPEDIIETLKFNGSKWLSERRRSVSSVEVGAFGFTVGLNFSPEVNEQYGFRSKLSLLCDRLASFDMGVLLLVDEASTSPAMRQVATTYQHLVGEDKNIAIAMAGLPSSVSTVLNDSVLTFLNRSRKEQLGPVDQASVRACYRDAFRDLGLNVAPDVLEDACAATRGFPYMVQLVGYCIQRASYSGVVTRPVLEQALYDAELALGENVYAPMLAPLSDNDRLFLEAMSRDDGESSVADIRARLGCDNSFLQPYRSRLLEAGVIESKRRGHVSFVLPGMAAYIRSFREDGED